MENELKLLIIDEDPDRRVNTRRAVQRAQLSDVSEIGYGTRAVSLALELRPDIILITVEEPVGRSLETAEAMANVLPDTPTIICSSINDPEAIRRAMLMGARHYISLPVRPEDLQDAVDTVLVREELRHRRRAGQLVDQLGRGTVITVTGGKGGIGKSVISVNLALGLWRETGMSVALLDAGTGFGDVATMLDVTPSHTVGDLISRLDQLDRQSIQEFLTDYDDGIQFLAASDEEGVWANIGGDDFKRVIDLLAQTFDFVVIDTAGSFDHLVKACVESSTLTLVVTSGEVSSVRNTTTALRRLESWEIPQEYFKVVLNHGVRNKGVSPEELAEFLNQEIFWQVPYDRKVPPSVQLGQPVVLFKDNSAAGRNLIGLSRIIAGTRKPLVEKNKKSPIKQLVAR